MAASDHAILVGINEYNELEQSDLKGAAADACEFKHWLINAEGGKVPKENITCIPYYGNNKSGACGNSFCNCYEGEPKYDVIRKAFSNLLIKSQNDGDYPRKIGRRLYIYMSGHGNSPVVDEPGIILPESSSNYIRSYPAKKAADKFFELKLFDEILLIMDCCLDSFGTAMPLGFPETSELQSDLPIKRSYTFATQWNEKTKEIYHEEKERTTGVFSDKLFDILNAKKVKGGPFTTKQIEYCIRKAYSGGRKNRYATTPTFLPNDEIVIYDDKSILVSLAIVVKSETRLSELNITCGDKVIFKEEIFEGGKRIFQCSVLLGIYNIVLGGNNTVKTHHLTIAKDTSLHVEPDFSLSPV